MSASTRVPPELLLDIFSLIIPKAPFPTLQAYLQRNRNLRSFALVHRTWTPVAQALLKKEICLIIHNQDQWINKTRNLITGRIQGTIYLSVLGPASTNFILAHHEMWQGVEVLELEARSDPLAVPTNLAHFAKFESESIPAVVFTSEKELFLIDFTSLAYKISRVSRLRG